MDCPDDFSIEYAWQSGSVPPPNYYEYTVTINADGHAWVTLLPDYPQHNPEPRRAEFSVSPEELERLCEAIHSSGLLTHPWKEAEDRSTVGAGSACLTIQFNGQVIQVPHLLSMVDGLRFTPVYEVIRDLAADTISQLRDAGDSGMVE